MPWFPIIITTRQLKEILMTATQDTINAITAQLGKAKDEILGEISNLEAQVAAGQAPDLTALKAAADALDGIVPDAPVVPEPGDGGETPVEEPTES